MKTNEICTHSEFCGGCIYQGVDYADQLVEKENSLWEELKINQVESEALEDISPAPSQFRYRNKMEYTFGDMEVGGELTLGMHRRGRFMSVVTVDHCQLVQEDFNLILKESLAFFKSYPKYHKKTHEGFVRNLVVRAGVRTREILVNIVTSSKGRFDEDCYVDMLRSLPLENSLVGVLHTINDRVADSVNCDELRVLWGRDYYMEEMVGLQFKVSAFSFFQTNVEAAERLYLDGIGLIPDFEDKVIFDLFCGTGTISQILARGASKVYGIEINEEAVDSAKKNAEINGVKNCEFICGDVFEELSKLKVTPDLIVVDPPRIGLGTKALGKICNYGVKEILYISCNPKTIAIDLAAMEIHGYKVVYLRPYDNFANTKHVETIALLQRVNS